MLFILFLFSVLAFMCAIIGALGIIVCSYFTLQWIVKMSERR